MEEDTTYFELRESGNFIRIEPVELTYPNAELEWDRNWIKSIITIKGGQFGGHYKAELMTSDFEKLKQDLKRIYIDLKGIVNFECIEGYIKLKITGDGFGHFNTKCIGMDNPNGASLQFELDFDQTYVPALIKQLERITKLFPITGKDFLIKNE